MTIILVLCTFLVFIIIDLVLSRREARAVQGGEEPAALAGSQPERERRVAGFLLPEDRRYHPGHGWALHERRNLLRIGVDEFAAALLGKIESLELPKPGQWVRQGQKVLLFQKQAESAAMLSPAEGEVLEVNEEVLRNPALVRKDPYGAGWLFTVFAPDEESTQKNLMPPQLVRPWLREAAERLYNRQPALAGLVAADGGHPVDDIAEALASERWTTLTEEFFLTGTVATPTAEGAKGPGHRRA